MIDPDKQAPQTIYDNLPKTYRRCLVCQKGFWSPKPISINRICTSCKPFQEEKAKLGKFILSPITPVDVRTLKHG